MTFDAAGFEISTPVAETETQRVIREAKALLRRPECWARNVYQEGDAFCIYGALDAASGGSEPIPGMCDAGRWVFRAREILFPDREGVAYFNDDPRTTHADVLAVLDRAYVIAGQPWPLLPSRAGDAEV